MDFQTQIHKEKKMKTKQLLPLLLLMIMSVSMIGCGTQIPSGYRGVFYSKFGAGTEFGTIYPEGFSWHMPWNNMFLYKIQLQESKETLTVLASDGASIRMEVSILYRPLVTKLDSLQATIGQNYYAVAVAPQIRSIARQVAGNFKPEEIYSTKRDILASEMIKKLSIELKDKFVTIENILIRDVQIPPKIAEAINFKLAAEQEALRMKFTIEKERKEAERKKIEAQGISDFQKIVSAGITPSLLKWKGIEATQKIAESPNSKVIIIGNDAGSLPIILSADKK